MDKFNELVSQQADSIRQQNAEIEQKRLAAEKDELDRQYKREKAHEQAVADRSITLAMAWAAAELLRMQEPKVQPQYWIRQEDLYEERGLFKKRRVPTKTRHSIVAQGWPLATWSMDPYQQQHIYQTLLLTPGETSLGTYLASFSQPWYERQRSPEDVRPENVHPLSKDPMSNETVLWPGQWPQLKYETEIPSIKFSFRFRETDDENWIINDPTFNLHKPNYEAYNAAEIENHVQLAIGRVVAQYLVVAPEQAQKSLAALAEKG